jgi:hypothetical protein
MIRVLRRFLCTGAFACETAAWIARSGGVPLAWIAENLTALRGVDVEARGELPPARALLVANRAGHLGPLAVVAEIPGTKLAGDASESLGLFEKVLTVAKQSEQERLFAHLDDCDVLARAVEQGLPVVPVAIRCDPGPHSTAVGVVFGRAIPTRPGASTESVQERLHAAIESMLKAA